MRLGQGYLHSTMFLLIRFCLARSDFFRYLFTFHNVSINSVLEKSPAILYRSFTFHNVSINSRIFSKTYIRKKDLHSTMFLLIPLLNFPHFSYFFTPISVDLRLNLCFSLIFSFKNYHISFIYAIVDVPCFLLYRTSTVL